MKDYNTISVQEKDRTLIITLNRTDKAYAINKKWI